MTEAAPDLSFFSGLTALAAAACPKRCNSCGRVYATAEQFITESEALLAGVTGLKQAYDDDQPIVEVYRNCHCGSTLMDLSSNRRDTSELGDQRRKLFNTTLTYLVGGGGLSPLEAREADMRELNRHRL